MTEIHELDAIAQGEAVRKGELSPVELVEHYLGRISRHDNGSFVTVTADAARQRARQSFPDTPLAGVPTAIKDLTSVKGVVTTFGSKAYQDFVSPVDGHAAALIKAAGMISLGKTSTPEFGASAYTPGCPTPWDVSRNAGGSSGGASAAVAAGLVPVAHGSDGGGSLRIPASACGVFGFKPSRGRVSNGPLGNDVTGLSVQGPVSRSVRDAAALLDVMAVPMPGDPHWAPPLAPGESFLAATRQDPGKLRIARFADARIAAVDPQCLAAYEQTTSLLLELGHEVEEVENPFPPTVADLFRTTWSVQQLLWPVDDGDLLPITRWWREEGRAASGMAFYQALVNLQLIGRNVVQAMEEYDAILTPTLAMPPQPEEWFTSPADRVDEMLRQTAFSPFTAGFNITGQPSASLPLYWTPDGLPIGSMVTGRPAGEAQLFSLCAQLERARPWSHRWPSL